MATTSTASNSKRHNVSSNVSKVDRISSLPESIISRILSLLPTKYAVATSILSTNWRFRWTSIYNLDFDDSLPLLYPEKNSIDKHRRGRKSSDDEKKKLSFMRFVNRVLLLLNPQCICKFRFACSKLVCDKFQAAEWISAALAGNIRELDLSVSHLPSIEIPRILFTCKTIVVLKLSGASMIFKIPVKSVCFPNLKILHLIYVKYTIDESRSKLSEDSICVPNIKIMHPIPIKYANDEFFSCPVLEELIIQTTAEDVVPNLGIYAPALRSLRYIEDVRLFYCTYDEDAGDFICTTYDKCKLQINAPELEYLKLVIEHEVEEVLVEMSSSLLKAYIETSCESCQEILSPSHCNCVLELFKGVCNAKFLSLSRGTLDALDSLPFSSDFVVPVFHNLTRLELEVTSHGWDLVPPLLESSYNLEHLACTMVYYPYCSATPRWPQPSQVPKCLLSCFKSVQISYPGDFPSTDEHSLISYILKNAKVLEKMTIRTSSPNLMERFKLIQKIAMFPRGSQTCQVDFA